MIKKENIKIGVGATLLIAALAMSGCSMNNASSVANTSSIENTIDSIENSNMEISIIENKELEESKKRIEESKQRQKESEERLKELEKQKAQLEIQMKNNEINNNMSINTSKGKEIFIPQYTRPDDSILYKDGVYVNDYVIPEIYAYEDGKEVLQIPNGYTLVQLDNEMEVTAIKEENDYVLYDIPNFNENLDNIIGVRNDKVDLVKAANNLNYNIVNGFTDGEYIIDLEHAKTSNNIDGIIVPYYYGYVDSNATDKINANYYEEKEQIPMGTEFNENGVLYYRLDGESMEGYYGIKTEVLWFYEEGMGVINYAKEEMRNLEQQNSYKR